MRGVASPRDRIERLLFVAMLSLSAAGTADLRLCSQMQIDPPFSLMGEKAVGRFENDTIGVSGGTTGTPVVTEIIPE